MSTSQDLLVQNLCLFIFALFEEARSLREKKKGEQLSDYIGLLFNIVKAEGLQFSFGHVTAHKHEKKVLRLKANTFCNWLCFHIFVKGLKLKLAKQEKVCDMADRK